jgi:hypothetical protein
MTIAELMTHYVELMMKNVERIMPLLEKKIIARN